MKKMLRMTVVFAIAFLFAPLLSTESNEIDISRVMALIGPSFAHACPVGEKVMTAGHVVLRRNVWGKRVDLRWSWEDSGGRSGVAIAGDYDEYRDLGEIEVKGDELSYYDMALFLPPLDSEVYWAQFDKKSLQTVRKSAKLKYYRAGYAFFDDLPDTGASGSCLFDGNGDVFGIVVWRITKNMQKTGVATLLLPR